MPEWLMVGSAPSVTEWFPVMQERLESPVTVTCNNGIKLFNTGLPLNYYIAVDQMSTHTNFDAALHAQKGGTQLVNLKRDQRALEDRRCDHFDMFLTLSRDPIPTRSKYSAFRYTGPLSLEFCCHSGAKTIHIIGFDGYRHVNDYFDPEATRKHPLTHDLQMREVSQACHRIATAWHDVEFIRYGDPVFSVSAKNWRESS